MRQRFIDLANVLLGAATAHAYVTLFFVIAVEEAGIPLPIPGDLVIAYYGWRAARDPYEIAQTILCVLPRRPPARSCPTGSRAAGAGA